MKRLYELLGDIHWGSGDAEDGVVYCSCGKMYHIHDLLKAHNMGLDELVWCGCNKPIVKQIHDINGNTAYVVVGYE